MVLRATAACAGRGQGVGEGGGEGPRLGAPGRDLLGHRFDARDLPRRPAGELGHGRDAGHLVRPMPGVHEQGLQPAAAQQAPVRLPGPQGAAPRDIVRSVGEGLEVQERRAEAAHDEAQRLVELRRPGGAGR